MAPVVPVVTNVNPATWDAAGIINLLGATHTWGSAWSVAAHTTGQSTALRCLTPGQTHTCIFRKESSGSSVNIALSVEPTGTITDGGNDTPTSPAGTTSDWSDEWTYNTSKNAPSDTGNPGSQLWIAEYPDALLILIMDPNNVFNASAVHIGKIYQPRNANFATTGQDGLGGLSGEAAIPSASASADQLINLGTGATAGLLHYETNNWMPRSYVTTFAPTNFQAGDGSDGENAIYPGGYPAICDIGGQTPIVGEYKYIRIVGLTAEPKTIKNPFGRVSNQGLLHMNTVATASWFTFVWDRRQTV